MGPPTTHTCLTPAPYKATLVTHPSSFNTLALHPWQVYHQNDWDWGFVGCTSTAIRLMADTNKTCARNWPGCRHATAPTAPPLPKGFNGLWPPREAYLVCDAPGNCTWDLRSQACRHYPRHRVGPPTDEEASAAAAPTCTNVADPSRMCDGRAPESQACDWILRAGMCGPNLGAPAAAECTSPSRMSTFDHHGVRLHQLVSGRYPVL